MTNAGTRNAGTTTLLLVQVVIGYEWLVSALTKVIRGDFPGGLAGQLGDMSKDSPGWYRGFLTSVVLPHADAFGYSIEIVELLAGITLVGVALGLLVRPVDLPRPAVVACVVASAAALAMVVNFELANGAGFGLSLGKDTFDEGVDLDTLMTGLQLALLLFWGLALRRRGAQEPSSNSRRTSFSAIRSWLSSRQPTMRGVGKP